MLKKNWILHYHQQKFIRYRCSCVQHAWIWRNNKNERWKWGKKYEKFYIVAKASKIVSGWIQKMNNIAKTTLHIYQIRKKS